MGYLKVLTQQILEATNFNKPTIVLGDANHSMNKWEEGNYPHKKLASEVTETLAMCRMRMVDLGTTSLADRLTLDLNQ